MKRCLNVVAFILVIVGALNWGLWGFFQFDLVAWLFHGNTVGWSRVVYSIVGLAGVWSLGFSCKCLKELCCCKSGKDKHDGSGSGCCKM